MTNLETARAIRGTLRYKLGLAMICCRHPVLAYRARLGKLNDFRIANVLHHRDRIYEQGHVAAAHEYEGCAKSFQKSDRGTLWTDDLGIDPLLVISIVQLIIRVALWLWDRDWSRRQ